MVIISFFIKWSHCLITSTDFHSTTAVPEATSGTPRKGVLLLAAPVEGNALGINAALHEAAVGVAGEMG